MEDESTGIFCETFGINPKNKIIEFFLEARELDFGAGDVAKETELNRATTYNVIEELLKEKIIVESRKLGRTQLFKLNVESSRVQTLIQAFNMLLKKVAEEYAETEELVA